MTTEREDVDREERDREAGRWLADRLAATRARKAGPLMVALLGARHDGDEVERPADQ